MSASGQGQVPAAERALEVLRFLAGHARPVTAGAVAAAIDAPRSSTYHLLATLERARFVVHLPEERRWALGIGAFELGAAYLRQGPLARLATPLLHRLAEETGIATHLAVLDGRDILYLVAERPRWTRPLVVEVGVRLPAHLTASGRSLLAEQPDAQVHALFPDPASMTRRTETGPVSPRELRRVLADVRARGHATEDGEIDPALASVAVAAHDHGGRGVAAVTLTFPGTDHDDDARAALAARARVAADDLTERLGGRLDQPGAEDRRRR